MKLSVIIPCYNAEKTVADTLNSLVAQVWDGDWEVIVANNGSTDQTCRVVESFKGKIRNLRIVDASARQGTSFAVNTGVEAAVGDSVVFCDADDVPAPGWLAAMGAALEQHTFVACRMDYIDLNDPLVVSVRKFQTDRLSKIDYPPYLYHAGGSTLGVRRSVFLNLGGYDTELIYLHDTDFCFKAQLSGHPLFFAKDAVNHIRLRSDINLVFRQARTWAAYNVLLAKRYGKQAASPPGCWRPRRRVVGGVCSLTRG
jgi:glycosyltransferase involved in cell wall biosynthesis